MTEERNWKRQMSAGGIVYKKENGPAFAKASARKKVFILLIQPSGKTQNKESKWTFPKGLIDKDEKPQQTAVREVREEAGVGGKIVENLGAVKYIFKWQGENIFKVVQYYLMEYVSGDPSDHDWEVADARWFELSEAEKRLSYKTDKEVFGRAKKILDGYL